MDDEFRAGAPAAASLPGSAAAAADVSAGGWARLATAEQTRKENVQQAGTWAGAPPRPKNPPPAAVAGASLKALGADHERLLTKISAVLSITHWCCNLRNEPIMCFALVMQAHQGNSLPTRV